MPIRLTLPETFAARLAAASRPQVGLWVCSGNPIMAEIAAGSGVDWVLIDGEHSPNGLESILAQLYAVSAYPIAPVVRIPFGEPVVIKQVLDLGAQNLLVPMVDSAEQAAELVRAVRYPSPEDPSSGLRGVGASLARSARWNRVEQYLRDASSTVSLTVQVESARAIAAVDDIVAVDGVDAIFVGPADLAASMGHLGRPGHPEVVAAVLAAIRSGNAAGVPVGVNAFVPEDAERFLDAGADFVAVGADVSLFARGAEALADRFTGRGRAASAESRESY
ncbi:HpcH/HpaI aldolase family protein [Agromyces aerolatus]|uniref:HpcH/HpaI aldolase family protein n=1 Tax=Agromyces sp. LY-1074 TaxID=3074080 RepID=UPI002862EE49|nr:MULTISPECIES: HpcH/HpaI aldolase/citrate lyase family protein [unclassified Agromyces]MDR5700286.1 HpcH/HpaI aldolase/citrate lyase family protein [Agromyces sp. LY-1074]MDR5706736.1 HpcH/HpaI aldolase/citrate lyase family protein [Agromyces sp. LY-1358]